MKASSDSNNMALTIVCHQDIACSIWYGIPVDYSHLSQQLPDWSALQLLRLSWWLVHFPAIAQPSKQEAVGAGWLWPSGAGAVGGGCRGCGGCIACRGCGGGCGGAAEDAGLGVGVSCKTAKRCLKRLAAACLAC
eukprot:scaffold258431_cov49-Prasinocladus_malaysianus.AAC.2